ncbi:MAG: TetR/AcrR family transcriptional regulator [Caulobacter sp.]|nr:TetR/AcrR family transcriptional regulator [Caulobacter sp.]
MSISTPGIAPRTRRSPEAARENILAAAESILIDAGPQHLKLAQVARAAGVVHASVLHHFGSIDGVQSALMARMVQQLVARIVAITAEAQDPAQIAGIGVEALFDAFEERGAARLAAWLELTGESRRLTLVREAVREVIAARMSTDVSVSAESMEDFILASISIALGVGLFGATLSVLLGKPEARARDVALALLRDRLAAAISKGPR